MSDLKPEAAAEVCGMLQPIATRTPGIDVCEHLPKRAAKLDKNAVIRLMTHGLPSHEHAMQMVLTGIDMMPMGAIHTASRSDWPCSASTRAASSKTASTRSLMPDEMQTSRREERKD